MATADSHNSRVLAEFALSLRSAILLISQEKQVALPGLESAIEMVEKVVPQKKP